MAGPEGPDVVLEGALVLEVGAAEAEPASAAVFLVRAPIALDGQALAALAASEPLGSVLSLVVGLQGPEVLQGLGPRVRYVILAPFFAAVAWHTHHGSRLRPLQRVRTPAVLRSVAPHS